MEEGWQVWGVCPANVWEVLCNTLLGMGEEVQMVQAGSRSVTAVERQLHEAEPRRKQQAGNNRRVAPAHMYVKSN